MLGSWWVHADTASTGGIPCRVDQSSLFAVRNEHNSARHRRTCLSLTVASETSISNPELDLIISMDVLQIWAGALKVAYLAAFDFLGDSFLDDPLNSAWRQVIEAKTMDTLTQSPIRFQIRLTGAIPCPLQPTQHFVSLLPLAQKDAR